MPLFEDNNIYSTDDRDFADDEEDCHLIGDDGIDPGSDDDDDDTIIDPDEIAEYERLYESVFESSNEQPFDLIDLTDQIDDIPDEIGTDEYLSKDKKSVWTERTIHSRKKRFQHNVFRVRERDLGPKVRENNHDPVAIWRRFFSDEMMNLIVHWTNVYAEQETQKLNQNWQPVTTIELDAFFGFLLLCGANGDSSTLLNSLYQSSQIQMSAYKAAMSINRFKSIMRYLRFDDKSTRSQREQTDKFAAISELWNMFIENCKNSYEPDIDLTVDEQLYGYKGGCRFIQYMPAKPAKYGIKIFWICEAKTGFALNAKVYLGKLPNGQTETGLAIKIVQNLAEPYLNSGRNITMDRYFTRLELAEWLMERGLSCVGTMNTRLVELPPVVCDKKRELYSSMILYNKTKDISLTGYNCAKDRVVVVASTMHYYQDIQAEGKKKPEVILDYNKTKIGVDLMDRQVSYYTCQRSTRRWPVAKCKNMLNIAALNSYIIMRQGECGAHFAVRNGGRKKFIQTLAGQLMLPYMKTRLLHINLHTELRDLIQLHIKALEKEKKEIANRFRQLDDDEELEMRSPQKVGKKPCSQCARAKKQKKNMQKNRSQLTATKQLSGTYRRCNMQKCTNHICAKHTIYLCAECAQKHLADLTNRL